MKRGTFKIINKSDIEVWNPTNTISLLPDIKRENIVSVSVNGIVENKWIYVLNAIFMLEPDLRYNIESSDIITIKTDMNIINIFESYKRQQKLYDILEENTDEDINEWVRIYNLNNK